MKLNQTGDQDSDRLQGSSVEDQTDAILPAPGAGVQRGQDLMSLVHILNNVVLASPHQLLLRCETTSVWLVWRYDFEANRAAYFQNMKTNATGWNELRKLVEEEYVFVESDEVRDVSV